MKFRVPGSGLDVASVSCSSPEDKEESIEYAGQKFWTASSAASLEVEGLGFLEVWVLVREFNLIYHHGDL